MNERIAILNQIREDRKLGAKKSINANSVIYGSCRHRPKFHRFICYPTSADEEHISSERSEMEGCNVNPSVPLADVTNLRACKMQNKISNNIVGTDSGSRYNILSMDV